MVSAEASLASWFEGSSARCGAEVQVSRAGWICPLLSWAMMLGELTVCHRCMLAQWRRKEKKRGCTFRACTGCWNTYIYVCVSMYIFYTDIFVYTCIHFFLYIYICIYIYIYIHLYLYRYIYICMCIGICR